MRRRKAPEREWKLIEPHAPARLGTGRGNYLLGNAVLYRVRTGRGA